MKLSELQQDALGEMANISASRAAKQLSVLLDDSIEIMVPDVSLVGLEAFRGQLEASGDGTMACVHQELNGTMEGRVHLVLHDEGSRALIHALVSSTGPVTEEALRQYEHEAMTEVGNIIISTFSAMLADLLQGELRLGMPHYSEGTIDQLLFSMASPAPDENAVVVVIKTVLSASQRDVSGALLVLLRVRSVEQLLRRLDDMIRRYMEGKPPL